MKGWGAKEDKMRSRQRKEMQFVSEIYSGMASGGGQGSHPVTHHQIGKEYWIILISILHFSLSLRPFNVRNTITGPTWKVIVVVNKI